MHIMIDLISSSVIGGLVLVMLLGFNGSIMEESAAQSIKIMAQTNFSEVTNIVEYEFRKMGYNVPMVDSSITLADSNKIKFKGDFDNNGTMDTLTYYYDPVTASGQQNTKTHILYRTWNSQSSKAMNLGVARFKLTYYDASGNPFTTPVSTPSKIKSLKIALDLESTVPYKETTEKYLKINPGVYWERIFKPKNLR